MAMTDYKKSKFKFSETFNNSNGKTSGSGFVGVLMGLISLLGFIIGSVGWYVGLDGVMDYLDYVLQLSLLSAVLMGVRKASGVFASKKEDASPVTPVTPTPLPVEEQG